MKKLMNHGHAHDLIEFRATDKPVFHYQRAFGACMEGRG